MTFFGPQSLSANSTVQVKQSFISEFLIFFNFHLEKLRFVLLSSNLGLDIFLFSQVDSVWRSKLNFQTNIPLKKKMFLCSSHYYFEVSSVVQALNSKHITSCHQKLFQMHQGISIRRPLHSKTFLSTIHWEILFIFFLYQSNVID